MRFMTNPLRFPRVLAAGGLLLGLLLCGTASSSHAAVIHVPGDQPTIQDAFNAANLFGDVIELADGTYTGASNRDILFDKHVTVRSASGDPTTCIIDCQSLGRAFLFDGVVSAARLEGVTIINGVADQGGGIAFTNSSATVVNCRILGNVANNIGGGGIAVDDGGSPTLINCVISGNTRVGIGIKGGGVLVAGGSTPTFVNCTLSGNSAWDASAIFSLNTGTVTTLVNCIVWGNAYGQTGVDIQNSIGAVTNITYSDVEDGFAGTGNIDVSPGFLDADGADDTPGTLDDDVRIGKFSPCTDAGDNSATGLTGILTDIGGGDRFVDDANVVDTGNGAAPLVDLGAHERQEDSVSLMIHVPADAATIQAGIDLAQFGDEVVVADGTYTGPGNRDLSVTKDITVRSASGDPALCIVDCEQASKGLTFTGTSAVARLVGITITNGLAAQGAGISFSGSDAVVENCRILQNTTNSVGGGGMGVDDLSSPTIVNCTLVGNTRVGLGVSGGGAFVTGQSTPTFVNCTFTANSGYDASAVYSVGSGTVTTLVNCIVWGNAPGVSGDPIKDNSSTTIVTYSDVEGGNAGAGNLSVNPIFADADYRIAPISPCIDAGDNGAVSVSEDYDGHQRIFDGDGNMTAVVDMGAFEYGAGPVVGIPGDASPSAGVLLRVWPNPARGGSHIGFALSRPGYVRVDVFDVAGRRVRTLLDGSLGAGDHEVIWDGRDARGAVAGAGVYFLRLASPDGQEHGRILRLR